MAKLYSEKLNKYYDMGEADLLAEDEAAYDEEQAEIEAKKSNKEARLHEVEAAYDAAYEAHIKALRMKDEFIKDYGSIRIKREFKPNGFMYNPINNLMTSLYDLFDL